MFMNVTVLSRKEVWFRAKEDQGGDPGTPRGFQAGEKREFAQNSKRRAGGCRAVSV